ncbi:hypothetical protein RRG08_005238 [Elysia crispata]|uniref:Uncharacterized protein n=1 Tax=Elysia crispata TaxID=231223 RepID=A0AAE1AM09_9GAST|nr:hypothetical protein RRG08_005238 [Elysia crispata]
MERPQRVLPPPKSPRTKVDFLERRRSYVSGNSVPRIRLKPRDVPPIRLKPRDVMLAPQLTRRGRTNNAEPLGA